MEFAGDENINQVINSRNLHPLIFKLFSFYHGPDVTKAEIAKLLIQESFNYLYRMNTSGIILSHQRTIDEAVDLSNYLVESLKPEEERKYSRPQPLRAPT